MLLLIFVLLTYLNIVRRKQGEERRRWDEERGAWELERWCLEGEVSLINCLIV